MKRWIGFVLALSVAAFSAAQAPFTLLRPADGAKVREGIRIVFPKGSVPDGGYVGIFLNGKFIEAMVPQMGAQNLEYILDTKKLKVADGPTTIEAVLYVDFNERPRKVATSSVQVTVANQPNIPIPPDGFNLRYAFGTGKKWVYHMQNNVITTQITEDKIAKGGRPAVVQTDSESVRLLYSIDNTYSGGDALVRMQALPDKGKNSVFLTTPQVPQGRVYWAREMHPVYMRVRSTGLEVFGSVPQYFTMGGSAAPTVQTDLYAVFPLPTLPSKKVSVGDTWQSRFQVGFLNLDNVHGMNNVTEKIPARGEFMGIEWEQGHPCAKIKHSFAVGKDGLANSKLNAIAIDETIWFALDKSVVVKIDRSQTFETKVSEQGAAPSGAGTPNPTRDTAPSQLRRGGQRGTTGPRGRRGSGGSDLANSINQATGGKLRGGRLGAGSSTPAAGTPAAATAAAGGAPRADGNDPIITTIRRTFQQILTLEQ